MGQRGMGQQLPCEGHAVRAEAAAQHAAHQPCNDFLAEAQEGVVVEHGLPDGLRLLLSP